MSEGAAVVNEQQKHHTNLAGAQRGIFVESYIDDVFGDNWGTETYLIILERWIEITTRYENKQHER